MKRTGAARVLATIFIGVVFGVYTHFRQLRMLAPGRDAYLVERGRYFDKIAGYHSAATMLIAGIILVAVGVGLYELIAAGIASILPPSTAEE